MNTHVTFYQTSDGAIIEAIDTMIVPRVGELVYLDDDTFRVVDVGYLYPRPGSIHHRDGKGPSVNVMCEPSEGMFQP